MSYLNGIQKGVGKDEKMESCFICGDSYSRNLPGYGQEAQAMVGGKPVIGISWKSPKQAKSYEAFKKIITMAGGIPVELDQIKARTSPMPPMGTVDKA